MKMVIAGTCEGCGKDRSLAMHGENPVRFLCVSCIHPETPGNPGRGA